MSQRILSKIVSSVILSVLEFCLGGGGGTAWELCDRDGVGSKALIWL